MFGTAALPVGISRILILIPVAQHIGNGRGRSEIHFRHPGGQNVERVVLPFHALPAAQGVERQDILLGELLSQARVERRAHLSGRPDRLRYWA